MTHTDSIAAPAQADDEDRRFPHWRRNLRVLPAANLLCSLGFGLSWPFLPLMVLSLGIAQDELANWLGRLMLAFYVIGFFFAPLWGSIADHFGRKVMILRAMMGMGFFMALIPLAHTPLWFAVMLLMVGAFNGFMPAGLSLLVANTPPKRIGSALSLAQTGALTGGTLGPALGVPLAAFLSERHGMFWLSGALLLAGGFMVLFWVREVKQLAEGPWRPRWLGSLRELAAVPGIAQLLFLAFIGSMIWNGNVTVLSIFTLQLLAAHPDAAHADAFWVGAVAMALSLSSVAAAPLWGRVLDRHPPAKVLTLSVVLAALTSLPVIFVQTPLQLVVARVAFGLAAAAMVPSIIRMLKEYAPRGMDARAISYASSFQLIAMGIAPFLAGLVGSWLGLRAYFVIVVLVTLAGLAAWLRHARKT